VRCDYFDAGVCRSCALMGVPYAAQLADKDALVRAALASRADASVWAEPFSGPESGFRNKAKLVVGGRRGDPVLGILDGDGAVADLTRCGLYEPVLREAVLALPGLVGQAELTPYDVRTRNGELKHVLATHSPDGELMLRFVLRSAGQLERLRRFVPTLQQELPGATVVSANLLPEHKAVLEGAHEVVLTAHDSLAMRVNDVVLHLRPQSFFQTNTTVAAALYHQATEWVAAVRPELLWDLYCGVGGFALHALVSGAAQHVVGVEVSEQAVQSARRTSEELGMGPGPRRAEFRVGDASSLELAQGSRSPDLVVVNPPRRGIGAALAHHLDTTHAVRHVAYSSCNVTSLARDLESMPSFEVRSARLFDMFPQTSHHEVLVLLERR
jgi:23S rRNA (uracil747-C5)-methyltransferase